MNRETGELPSGEVSPGELPRSRSPVSLTDGFSSLLEPRLLRSKPKGRDTTPNDASLRANVAAISLLTSPMASLLGMRHSGDVLRPLPGSGAPSVDAVLNAGSMSGFPLPTLPRDTTIAENAGLRYRGHAGRKLGYGLSLNSTSGRSTSVVSSRPGGDEHAHVHRRRPRRPHSLCSPFNSAFNARHVDGVWGLVSEADPTHSVPDEADAWAALAPPSTTKTCGSRLRDLLYPKPSDVGIEGAESLINRKMEKRSRRSRVMLDAEQPYERLSGDVGQGGGRGGGHSRHHRLSLANEADEGLMHIELPVAAVLDFTAQQRRTAELVSGFCWYLPVLVMVSLLVLFSAPKGPRWNLITDGVVKSLDSNLERAASIGREILLEAVRIDTEQYSNDSRGNFVEGGSEFHPWIYSHYNATVNSWTPQPDPRAAVDAQVTRVASYHRNPTLVRLRSVRTKRDVMRWLKNVFLPHLWDCQSPTYERPWTEVVHGTDRLVGSARLTARRRAAANSYTNSSYVCKRASLAGLDISCQAGSGTEFHTSVAPPLVPASICNRTNPALPEETLFVYEKSHSGYVAQLPFSASCNNVEAALNLMETRKESILWPPYSREYAHMTELWSEYEMDTSDVGSCSSFFFHLSVTELQLEYVLYSGSENTFFYARVDFSFAATGSVVVPTVSVYSAPALSWDSHFAQLGISIVTVLVVIIYAVHSIVQFTADYQREQRLAGRALTVDKEGSLRGLAAAVQRFLRLWPIVCFTALTLTTSSVVAFWASIGRERNRMVLTYAARNEFPTEIAKLCVETYPVYRRLGVAALFFVYIYLLRFTSVMLGAWATMEAIEACATRVFTTASIWFFTTIGVAICGRLLFGGVLHEFSSFGRAYMTVVLLFVDRCRFLFTQVTFNSNRNRLGPVQTASVSSSDFDTTLPSVHGSSLGVSDPTPVDTKRRIFEGSNSPELHVFLLFFIYIQFFLFIAVLMTILMEAFRQSTVALHISRMSWALTLRHVRRALSLDYGKESLRRWLWGRRPALLFDDVARYVSLTDAAMLSQGVKKGIPGALSGATVNGYGGKSVAVLQSHLDTGAHISYAGVLWRFPRAFQAEFGAMHLRQWWLMCVDSVRFLHHNDPSWLDERLAAYYDAKASGLSGWLKAGTPPLSTLEERVFSVDAALEELPHKIVRYVELEMQEAPPLRSAETRC